MTDKDAASKYKIPVKLVEILRSLPKYDPFALAQPGDYFDIDTAENVVELFEAHIKHPEGPLVGQPFKLERWQEATLLNFYGWRKQDGKRRYNECLIYIGKKNGKALAIDTPIPTPSGWKSMGELKKGDIVFDEKGKQCRVIQCTETMYNHECYELEFSDGEKVVADAEHLWVTTSRLKKGNCNTFTTKQIAESLRVEYIGSEGWNHSIGVCDCLETNEAELPIPPYALGVWLGDGISESAGFVCCDKDADIVSNLKDCGIVVNKFNITRENNVPTYSLWMLVDGKPKRGLLKSKLNQLNLIKNKHIPQCYLRASKKQRFELLQGIMDTDGYVSKSGQCNITTISEQLADSYIELLRSLGYKPMKREKYPTINGKVCNKCYLVDFYPSSNEVIAKLKRKQERVKAPTEKKQRSKTRHIVGCKKVNSVPVKCIQVDSESSLYLCGKGMIPTHNTTFSAGWLAIELRYLAAFGAQFYSAAASRDQAALVFNCIAKMLNFDKDLAAGLNVYGSSGAGTSRSIVRQENMVSYKCMSKEANTGDGVSPDFLLIDELHRHKDGELTETLEKSTAAKPDAIIIKTTTADYDRPSVCNRTVAYGRNVCANDGDPNKPGYDPAFLPVIFEISPSEYKADPECWKKPETWRKANPNIGVSVPESFYVREVQKCIDDPALLNNFLRLHLNIVTEQSEIWIPMDKWDACQTGRTDEELKNAPCWAGFDLSATQDLTALSLCWKHPDGGYDMRWWFWIPGDDIEKREKKDGVHYRVWQTNNHIELIPGEVVDIECVQDRLVSIFNDYKVQTVAADPWNNSSTMQFLMNRGFNVKVFRQGPSAITEPGKEMMRRIIEGTFRHNANPIARWNASNAMIKNAPNETFSLDKDRAERRIDGIAAAIMAIGCAMEYEEKTSAYTQGGVIWGSG